MKRLAAIAMIVAWIALPVCAQHGGSHGGGFGGHSGASSHGGFGRGGFGSLGSVSNDGFGAPGPSFHGGFARYAPPQFRDASPSSIAGSERNLFSGSLTFSPGAFPNSAQGFRHEGLGNSNRGAGFQDHRRHHRPFRRPFRRMFGYDSEYSGYYAGGWGGWIAPYLWAYPGFSDCPAMWNGWDCWNQEGDSAAGANYVAQAPYADYSPQNSYPDNRLPGYSVHPSNQDQALPWPGRYARPPAHSSGPPLPSSPNPPALPDLDPNGRGTVMLVFKDGRPPEEIHNYLLTQGTLYVMDRHSRAIPLDSLDLAATARANDEDGDFILPVKSDQ